VGIPILPTISSASGVNRQLWAGGEGLPKLVYKIGAATGLTRGTLVHDDAYFARSLLEPGSIPWDAIPLNVGVGENNLLPLIPPGTCLPMWIGQMCVMCTTDDKAFNLEQTGSSTKPFFALPGDSGALVWAVDGYDAFSNTMRVYALGILHTGDSLLQPQVYLCTPLGDAIKAIFPTESYQIFL
jgi:hypothetical protein